MDISNFVDPCRHVLGPRSGGTTGAALGQGLGLSDPIMDYGCGDLSIAIWRPEEE